MTTNIKTGPATADLTDVEIEEITVDAEPEENPNNPARENFVCDTEESERMRQVHKDTELTASTDSVRAYLWRQVTLLPASWLPMLGTR